jgi:hypothetical protein
MACSFRRINPFWVVKSLFLFSLSICAWWWRGVEVCYHVLRMRVCKCICEWMTKERERERDMRCGEDPLNSVCLYDHPYKGALSWVDPFHTVSWEVRGLPFSFFGNPANAGAWPTRKQSSIPPHMACDRRRHQSTL